MTVMMFSMMVMMIILVMAIMRIWWWRRKRWCRPGLRGHPALGASIIDDLVITGSTLGEAVVFNGQVFVLHQAGGSNPEEVDIQEPMVTGHRHPNPLKLDVKHKWDRMRNNGKRKLPILPATCPWLWKLHTGRIRKRCYKKLWKPDVYVIADIACTRH